MRLKKIILLFLLLFVNIFLGQKNNDSLLLAIKNHPQRDNIRCAILRELRKNAVRNFDYKTADFYDTQAGLIAKENLQKKNLDKKKEIQFKQFYADALNVKIDYYRKKNNYKKTIYYIKKSLKLHFEVDNKDDIGYDLMQLGNTNRKFGFVEDAIKNYFQSITFLKKREGIIEEENNYLCYIFDNLTQIYCNKGDYKTAIDFQFEKLKLTNKPASKVDYNQGINLQNIANTYSLIGEIYSKQNETPNAFKYFNKSLKLFKKIKDNEGISSIYYYIGSNYFKKNQLKKAIFFIKLSQKKTLDLEAKVQNNITLSNIYIKANLIDSAYFFSKKVLLDLRESKLSIKTTTFYQNLGYLHFRKNDFERAEMFVKKSIDDSKKVSNLLETQNSSDLLYQIYKAQNKNKLALKMLEVSTQLKDSINRKENQNAVLKADFKYQTEKKEAKISELNQKKKIAELQSNKKTILINSIIISFLALAILAYFLFFRFKEKKKNELLETKLAEAEKLLEAEKKATDSELKALKSQMNPHFIFNALNSIQEQFMYGDKLKGNEQLSNFTYLTRQILEVSGKKQITIATEIDILTKYLDLEKMRFAKDFEYKITTSNNIDEDYHKLPPMLLQPFVENSIKHGLLHKKGLKTLTIDFDLSSNEEYLICTIIDNGIGRQKSTEIKAANQVKHNSFSTQSIEDRLNLLNEKLQLNNLIVYTDLTENNTVVGTKVILNIPIV